MKRIDVLRELEMIKQWKRICMYLPEQCFLIFAILVLMGAGLTSLAIGG